MVRKLMVIVLAALILSACESWLVPEPTAISWEIPTGGSTTPTADVQGLLGASLTPFTPTVTATITLTPQFSPTPPVGSTSTVSWIMLTATAAGPASSADPHVDYFVAYPTDAKPGDIVTLFWKATNASDAAIWRVKEDGSPGRTWRVKTEGQMSIDTVAVGGEDSFVLSITNGIKTVEQLVSVKVGCQASWFFAPEPQAGCPETASAASGALFQGFEHGQMYWLQATNTIFVLFTDTAQPAWISLGNGWTDGMPEDDPALVPPEGMFQPRRELGAVWRDTPGLRDRLGWALGDVTAYSTTYQSAIFGEGKHGLYFTDPSNAIIQLVQEGQGWLVVGYLGS